MIDIDISIIKEAIPGDAPSWIRELPELSSIENPKIGDVAVRCYTDGLYTVFERLKYCDKSEKHPRPGWCRSGICPMQPGTEGGYRLVHPHDYHQSRESRRDMLPLTRPKRLDVPNARERDRARRWENGSRIKGMGMTKQMRHLKAAA